MKSGVLGILAILCLLPQANAATSAYGMGGYSAQAGKPIWFTINRQSSSWPVTLTFVTKDGTAKAGVDYDSQKLTITLAAGVSSQRVQVSTHVNSNAPGQTLHFAGILSLNGVVVSSAGSAIEEPVSNGFIPTVDLNGLSPIPTTDHDVNNDLQPSWGTGAIAADNGADPVGAFRFICGAGQLLYDDPIVYPGEPGVSHLHQFYGNLSANANSTFQSLRASGDSTCGDNGLEDGKGTAANRTGYWMPAMMVGNQYVVKPDFVSIYYKRRPATDPVVSDPSYPTYEGKAVPIPNGLRMIWGYDMVTNTVPTGHHHFACISKSVVKGNSFPNLVALANGLDCPIGARIEAMITAPVCWDGKNVDSPNHRDHVSYPSYGGWGYEKCDSQHPFVMPTFSLGAFYQVTPEVKAALDALRTTPSDLTKTLHLSSDEMRPSLPAGSTFHADYFEGWDPTVKQMWTNGCINNHLNCSGGDLGNGKQLKHAPKPVYNGVPSFTNPTPLVPVPVRP